MLKSNHIMRFETVNRLMEGMWSRGSPVFARIIESDGSVYIGFIKDGKRHGKGKFFTPEGDVTDGIWEFDVFKDNK